MASESTEERKLSVSIPAELDDWLDKEAAELDVDRETLLVQLLASYRTTSEFDGAMDADLGAVNAESFEDAVESHLDDRVGATVDKQVQETVDEQLQERVDEKLEETVNEQLQTAVNNQLQEILSEEVQNAVTTEVEDQLGSEMQAQMGEQVEELVESAATDQISEATNAVQRNLEEQIHSIEDDFQGLVEDVRERVIQVKKETDMKAPETHSHDEFEELPRLDQQVESMESELDELQTQVEETVPHHAKKVAEFDERLEQIEDRLQTVAWVVSDLRDTLESGGLEAVERIKRAAAKSDINRAKCESCGEGVEIALMTDPECPHCDAAVTNIEPAGGWFGDPKLLVASQLESGE